MKKILRFHGLDVLPAHCFRCGWRPRDGDWGWMQRAHVIDRWTDGLDLEPNLIPLCSFCHRQQPIFRPGQEDEAWRWMQGDPATYIIELADKYGIELLD